MGLQTAGRAPIPGLSNFTGTVGPVSRASLDKDPREVASMFDAVARYDLTNTVLSLGQDRFWRRATRSALRIGPGDKVLDLAAGTRCRRWSSRRRGVGVARLLGRHARRGRRPAGAQGRR